MTFKDPSNIPSMMRAWTYSQRGAPSEVLKLSTTHPSPPPPTGSQLLIRVSHAALTPTAARMISLVPSIPLVGGRPFVPDIECAGVVVAAGPKATLPVETHVFGGTSITSAMFRGRGSMAEYTTIEGDSAGIVPAGMGWAEAAGLNGNGQTALLMLENGGVKTDSRVFVNGTGGVGTMVVQVAKAAGAYVVATASGDWKDKVSALGADEVIDYRLHDSLPDHLTNQYGSQPFDAILDTIGLPALYTSSPAYLVPGGPVVNVGAMGSELPVIAAALRSKLPTWLGGIGRPYKLQQTNPNPVRAQRLVNLVEEGKLRVVIDTVFTMEDAPKAYDRILSQRAKGKVVVKIQDV